MDGEPTLVSPTHRGVMVLAPDDKATKKAKAPRLRMAQLFPLRAVTRLQGDAEVCCAPAGGVGGGCLSISSGNGGCDSSVDAEVCCTPGV